ncbi:hypothetical protein H8D98_01040 [bacterium]|nr:hypothetical protein [bacterium]
MRKKRVEYQKFLRIKLEDGRYRHLFGLSDNVELEGEEDLVLQREFRIDLVFRKIDEMLPLAGIFSYFRWFRYGFAYSTQGYNLFEFKSVNDIFDLVTLRKYIGELFWWLYAKETIGENEVTLTIMTVRKPINVLKHLENLQIEVTNENPGHYHWSIMGISIHLLVINELEKRPEYYAWLSFAEGKQYEAYVEQLSEDIAQDERLQIYLDILSDLEKEGKERMAYKVISRIIAEMPPELKVETLFGTWQGFLRNSYGKHWK